jgi:hypothetical protein
MNVQGLFTGRRNLHVTSATVEKVCHVAHTYLWQAPAFTLVSCSAHFFDPEDGGDMFLRNVG